MTQGEKLRVLSYEEDASAAKSLANRRSNAEQSVHLEPVSEAAGLTRQWRCAIESNQGNFAQHPDRQADYNLEGEIA